MPIWFEAQVALRLDQIEQDRFDLGIAGIGIISLFQIVHSPVAIRT